MEDSVRWSLKVSQETDAALRSYLGHVGGRKGDLSRFVQEAVQAKLAATLLPEEKRKLARRPESRKDFAETLKEIRARTGKLTQARFETLVTQALAHARKPR